MTKKQVLFISSFPPKKCGIASFTSDLIDAMQPFLANDMEISVCALDKAAETSTYESPVAYVTNTMDEAECKKLAGIINAKTFIELVCIEHEFGLYGGEMGNNLLSFLTLLEKPFVVRFHTVLPSPDDKRLETVQTICLLAERIIVMTAYSHGILIKDYNIEEDKIHIIPHGTHAINTLEPAALKKKYELTGREVLSTFGLISPNKGIETGINAMRQIIKLFPNAIYLVIGKTHPNLIEQEGEAYRHSLTELITSHDLKNNVILIDEYIPTRQLIEYLKMTDVYLFTSKDPNQAVSGTFIYAMSAGCAIISNDFVLAREMLDTNTGVIINSGDSNALSQNAIKLLGDHKLTRKMGRNAFAKTRNTIWKDVARKHLQLFSDIMEHSDNAVDTVALPIIKKRQDINY